MFNAAKVVTMETFKDLAQRVLTKSNKLRESLSSDREYTDKENADKGEESLPDVKKLSGDNSVLSLDADEYSVKDISSFTNIPEWTLRRLIKSGKLKADVASDSKNPGKARFVVGKENLKEFLNDNYESINDKNVKENDSKLKVVFDNLLEEFADVIEYGKLEIKRDEIDMKVENSDSLIVQRDIIEKQMMLKRLEIEKKFYQNYSFENNGGCKNDENSILGKVRNFLNHEL